MERTAMPVKSRLPTRGTAAELRGCPGSSLRLCLVAAEVMGSLRRQHTTEEAGWSTNLLHSRGVFRWQVKVH